MVESYSNRTEESGLSLHMYMVICQVFRFAQIHELLILHCRTQKYIIILYNKEVIQEAWSSYWDVTTDYMLPFKALIAFLYRRSSHISR